MNSGSLPTDKSEERKSIQKCCEALKKLLGSLERSTSVLPYLQDVGRICEASKTWPDDKMMELAEELRALVRTLKATPAGDGQPILSGPRHEEFLGPGTCS